MKVYFLSHSREIEPGVTSSIHIGIYSSMSIVDVAIEKYKSITGFKDYPNGFIVEEYEVISQNNKEILPGQLVYFLQHEYSVEENGVIYDYSTNINIFENYDDAKRVMQEMIKESVCPKSPDGIYAPDGFNIDKCIVDKDNWAEGFVSFD